MSGAQFSCKRRERKIEWQSANSIEILIILRKMKHEGKRENGRMVMRGMIGGRRRDGTARESPSSSPSSVVLFSHLLRSNASQRRSKGKSAPCSRSWKQTSWQRHPNELLTEPVPYSYTNAHTCKSWSLEFKSGPLAKHKEPCLFYTSVYLFYTAEHARGK